MHTQHGQLMESDGFRRLYAIEGLVAEAAELIAELMESRGVNKAELAKRLGSSRSHVTQLLSGSSNMTVRTLAEVAFALDASVKLQPLPAARSHAGARDERKLIEMRRRPMAPEYEFAQRERCGANSADENYAGEVSRYVA